MTQATQIHVMRMWRKVIFSPWGVVALVFLVLAVLDPANLLPTAKTAALALFNTAPYIVFAVLTIAYLAATGAETKVAGAFKGREGRAIILAALAGGLAPFCSCEVIPFIAGLLAMGVPLGPVMAFWLASPLIDPPTFLITAGALGWDFAIAKTLAAVGLGLMGGLITSMAIRGGLMANPLRATAPKPCGCGPSRFGGRPQWRFWPDPARRRLFKEKANENFLFLFKWMSLAYTFEALMIKYVPADLIARAVGGEGIIPVITAALIGAPAYLNGYVAPPLLAGLIEQGMGAGAALAFLVAGAVSSIPAMTAVWSLVRPGVFALYVALGISGAIVAGLAFGAISP